MNIYLLQCLIADVHEAMWRMRLDDEDISRHGLADLISDDKSRAPFLHNDDLIVFVQVKRRAASGLRFEQVNGDGDVFVVCADKIVRAADQG